MTDEGGRFPAYFLDPAVRRLDAALLEMRQRTAFAKHVLRVVPVHSFLRTRVEYILEGLPQPHELQCTPEMLSTHYSDKIREIYDACARLESVPLTQDTIFHVSAAYGAMRPPLAFKY